MGPDDLLLIVALSALTLYAMWGGADFGAGVWEFATALRSTEQQREHIYKAIGPVWEANHVWLIFVIVILMNCFPVALAALSRALWIPLLVALCGIVFRGASYAFRMYSRGSQKHRYAWEVVFAVASTAAPLFMGASIGAIASGKLDLTPDGYYHADVLTGWLSPLALFAGLFAVGMCAYLAAVYLTREAALVGDDQLRELWRSRSLMTGMCMGCMSVLGLWLVWLEAPVLADGFFQRGWPLILISLIAGMASLCAIWLSRQLASVLLASLAVASVVWGWGVSQYPLIVPPHITGDLSKAPDNVLWMVIGVVSIGSLFLLPALGYLFLLFKAESSD